MPVSGRLRGRRTTPALVCVLAILTASGLLGRPASATSGPKGANEGALSVDSDPAGAAVYVDGRFVGETPLTLPAVAAGDHRVRVVKDGYLENSRVVRVATGKAEALQLRLTSRTGQTPQASGLKIVVIEGEDAVNIIQQKTAVRPIVEVRDRNDLPIAGVPVVFTISGGGASFGGASTVTVTTNAAGRAAVTNLTPVNNGAFQIRVEASYQGQTATTQINQTNFATPADAAAAGGAGGAAAGAAGGAGGAGGGGLSNLAIAGIVGGAAVGTVGVLAATGVVGGNEPCTFAVSPTTVTAGSTAGSSTVNVTVSPANCDAPEWQVSTGSASFVTANPTSGSGNGSVTLTFTANNTTGQRTGTVTIANQQVNVTQSVACTFAVTPTTLSATSAGGALTVTVAASPAGCTPATWTASSNAAFVSVSPTSGTGNGTVTLTVSANTAAADRSGTVTVAGQSVTVNQSRAAAPCNAQQVAGGDIPETRTIELGRTSGTFQFVYDTAQIEDRLVIRYQNAVLFDTGCVGTNGVRNQSITYSGTSSTVSVEVTPNCRVPGSGTAWAFILSCPQ